MPAQSDALNKWASVNRFHVGDNLGKSQRRPQFPSIACIVDPFNIRSFRDSGIPLIFLSPRMQCSSSTPRQTLCWRSPRTTTTAAARQTPSPRTRPATPPCRSRDPAHTTSSAAPLGAATRASASSSSSCRRSTVAATFLRRFRLPRPRRPPGTSRCLLLLLRRRRLQIGRASGRERVSSYV